MVDILADDGAAVPEVHGVAPHVPHPAAQGELGLTDRTGIHLVDQVDTAQPRRPERHQPACVRSTSTRRWLRWTSRAAATRPAKSGCARCGRDLNSGCACVDT